MSHYYVLWIARAHQTPRPVAVRHAWAELLDLGLRFDDDVCTYWTGSCHMPPIARPVKYLMWIDTVGASAFATHK